MNELPEELLRLIGEYKGECFSVGEFRINVASQGDEFDYYPCPMCQMRIKRGTGTIKLGSAFVHYCKSCEIGFDYDCCYYSIGGCGSSLFYLQYVQLSYYGITCGCPKIPPRQIQQLSNDIANGICTLILVCTCPGYCPHDPCAYYPEYNGLGIECCKVSPLEKELSKGMLEKRLKK